MENTGRYLICWTELQSEDYSINKATVETFTENELNKFIKHLDDVKITIIKYTIKH